MTKEFLKIFGITIRDQLIMKNTVEVKGLGTFKTEHTAQYQKTLADGRVVMLPPSDDIQFKSQFEG